MAALNGNNEYVSINGRVVGAASGADANIYRKVEMDLATGDEDVSGGSGINWEEHADKLSKINFKVTIIYNPTTVSADIDAITNSLGRGTVVALVRGPEGNATGKPKHDQDVLITAISGPGTGHDKPAVLFEITGISSGAPRSNLYAGDTF